jgi:hypothetical protein
MNEMLMETKREMQKLTDHLMKELQEHTQNTKRKLEDLSSMVRDQTGRTLLDQTTNEV